MVCCLVFIWFSFYFNYSKSETTIMLLSEVEICFQLSKYLTSTWVAIKFTSSTEI